jgi:hypothetical protein
MMEGRKGGARDGRKIETKGTGTLILHPTSLFVSVAEIFV